MLIFTQINRLLYSYQYSAMMSCLAVCLRSLLETGTDGMCEKWGAIMVFHMRGPTHPTVCVLYVFLLNSYVKCLVALVCLSLVWANLNKDEIADGAFREITLCITTMVWCLAISSSLNISSFEKIGPLWAIGPLWTQESCLPIWN